MEQLALPCFSRVDGLEKGQSTTDRCTSYLAERLGVGIDLVFTQNRSTMLSSHEQDGRLSIRLHRVFLEADHRIWQALGDYLDNASKIAGRELDTFIAQHSQPAASRPLVLRTAGKVHDLRVIHDDVNQRFFQNRGQSDITWGRARRNGRRKSIQLGTYVVEDRLIRIHPALDQTFVPRYYVSWVVFHELLHEVFSFSLQMAKQGHHPPEFRAIEQSHPDYARARRWESLFLDRLLSYAPNHP